MKHFIQKTLIYLLPILLIALMMEILLRMIPNDYTNKRQYLDKHASEIQTLILGSSHTFYGLNPEYFTTKTYNAAYISQSVNLDYEIFMKYSDRFKELKTVIVPVSYFSLFEQLEDESEKWREKDYVIYYGIHKSKSIKDYSEVFSNRLDVNTERLISYYLKKEPNTSGSESGWGTNYNSSKQKDLDQSSLIAAKRSTIANLDSPEIRKIFKENQQDISSIIEWCEQHGVRVLILTPPVYKTYRENLDPKQLKETISDTKAICSNFKNCMYLDLLDDNRFTAADFYDGDHLSEIGAKKLSLMINDRINHWETGSK